MLRRVPCPFRPLSRGGRHRLDGLHECLPIRIDLHLLEERAARLDEQPDSALLAAGPAPGPSGSPSWPSRRLSRWLRRRVAAAVPRSPTPRRRRTIATRGARPRQNCRDSAPLLWSRSALGHGRWHAQIPQALRGLPRRPCARGPPGLQTLAALLGAEAII